MICFGTLKGPHFDLLTLPYKKYLTSYFQKLGNASQLFSTATKNDEYNSYIKYNAWPIRQLEYSYMIEKFEECVFPGARILDAGCGVSAIPFLWASYGAEVTAVDFDQENIHLMEQMNQQEYYGEGKKITLGCYDITDLPYEDEYFDIVTSISVIEHLDYPFTFHAFAELYRVLKPGGVFVCTVDCIPGDEGKKEMRFALSAEDIKEVLENFSDEVDEDTKNFRDFKLDSDQVREFWSSHYYDGIGYEGDRGYLSVGFCIKKQQRKMATLRRKEILEILRFADRSDEQLAKQAKSFCCIKDWSILKQLRAIEYLSHGPQGNIGILSDDELIYEYLRGKLNTVYRCLESSVVYDQILLDFTKGEWGRTRQVDMLKRSIDQLSEQGWLHVLFLYGTGIKCAFDNSGREVLMWSEVVQRFASDERVNILFPVAPEPPYHLFSGSYLGISHLILSKGNQQLCKAEEGQADFLEEMRQWAGYAPVYDVNESIRYGNEFNKIWVKNHVIGFENEQLKRVVLEINQDREARLADIFTLTAEAKYLSEEILQLQADRKQMLLDIQVLNDALSEAQNQLTLIEEQATIRLGDVLKLNELAKEQRAEIQRLQGQNKQF